MKVIVCNVLLWWVVLLVAGAASDSEDTAAYIYYFDSERPPVIEEYAWDNKRHWTLSRVNFDSDGDWAPDTVMIFMDPEGKAKPEDIERWRKATERYHSTLQGTVVFSPYAEGARNMKRIYKEADLYKIFTMDSKVRSTEAAAIPALSIPRPWWPGNEALRNSNAYRTLIKRLMSIRLQEPPKLPSPQR